MRTMFVCSLGSMSLERPVRTSMFSGSRHAFRAEYGAFFLSRLRGHHHEPSPGAC